MKTETGCSGAWQGYTVWCGYDCDPVYWTQYDGEWVFFQIYEYTADPYWLECAQAAEMLYRTYVAESATVPGRYSSTHGLTRDFLASCETGESCDMASRDAALKLSCCATYAPDTTVECTTESFLVSREVAFAIIAYLDAERLGEERRGRLSPLVDQALGHFDQWFGTAETAPTAEYVKPFMVALSGEALIYYNQQIPEDASKYAHILSTLEWAMDKLWERTWLPHAEAFMYIDRPVEACSDTAPAPDLNLLIAPVFAWVYHQTGETRFRDRGDAVFKGGVTRAYLVDGKHFNQSYRWTFDYLKWRTLPPLKQP